MLRRIFHIYHLNRTAQTSIPRSIYNAVYLNLMPKVIKWQHKRRGTYDRVFR
jgi:hypothetical protein